MAPKKQGDKKEAHIGMQAELSTTVRLDLARGHPALEGRLSLTITHSNWPPHMCVNTAVCN